MLRIGNQTIYLSDDIAFCRLVALPISIPWRAGIFGSPFCLRRLGKNKQATAHAQQQKIINTTIYGNSLNYE